MRLFQSYVLRMVSFAFVAALVTLTGVVWVTQALREVDLLTSQGQTLWLFFEITMLALPSLVMVIGPVALLIACLFTLNKLNADSELVIVHASGASPWFVGRPFMVLAVIVSALMAFVSLVLVPESARELRNVIAKVRADVLTDIVEPGKFSIVDPQLTFHIRDRRPDGTLEGLLVYDWRNEGKMMTYLAEEGRVVRVGDQAYLAMRNGSIQQKEGDDGEISIVGFETYVYDLSSLSQRSRKIDYHPREMRISELMNPDPENRYYVASPGRFRAELHDRFANILYPLAFVLISLATLGHPRTNRQGRGNAILIAALAAAAVRTAGFAAASLAAVSDLGVVLIYVIPAAAIVLAGWAAFWQEGVLIRLLGSIPTPSDLLDLATPKLVKRWVLRRMGEFAG